MDETEAEASTVNDDDDEGDGETSVLLDVLERFELLGVVLEMLMLQSFQTLGLGQVKKF